MSQPTKPPPGEPSFLRDQETAPETGDQQEEKGNKGKKARERRRRPLSREHLTLLSCLDKMLTVGQYYQPGHKKYQEVALASTQAVENALHEEEKEEEVTEQVFRLEITPEGFEVGDTFLAKDQQEARRIYDLLEPLNVALLEIYTGVTSDELHEAMTLLKQYRQSLIGARSYQVVEIKGLPKTIKTMDKFLWVRTRDVHGRPGGTRPLSELIDPSLIPDVMLVPTPDGQTLEREFLGIVNGIIQNGDPVKLRELQDAIEGRAQDVLASWIPDHAIKKIKEILDALAETNTDPMALEHLIGHAVQALEMTGDSELVELVFEKLRKDEAGKKKQSKLLENRPKPRNPKKNPVRFTMSRPELRTIIDELEATAEQPEDLTSPATADLIGICIQVLGHSPNDQLREGIASTLWNVLTVEDINDLDIQVIRDALVDLLRKGELQVVDQIIQSIFVPLKETRHELIGPIWLDVWKQMERTDHQENAWPFIVNDILMGIEWKDPGKKLALYESLSRFEVKDRKQILPRLEKMQALQDRTLEPDLFHAPAPLLYSVHQVLMNSTLADLHGPRMHKRLAHQRAHRLADILIDGLDEYNHSNRMVYQAILEQGLAERIAPDLKDLAGRQLKGTLTRLPAKRRGEEWVPEAIGWLGKLDPERARPVLDAIIREKKWLFFPVWPSSCRDAAREALQHGPAHYTPEEER